MINNINITFYAQSTTKFVEIQKFNFFINNQNFEIAPNFSKN